MGGAYGAVRKTTQQRSTTQLLAEKTGSRNPIYKQYKDQLSTIILS